MADVTISGLPNASTLAGTERVPMDQAGVTVDASSQEIANLATAASVGLGNVNNTSDANKPVSTATQTALDDKAATSHTQAASTITGLATVATSGSASDLAAGTLPAARLPDTTVAAGSYGSASLVPVITVDAAGRITAASTAAVSGGGGGTVTSVTGTAPITSSGGTTPAISISAATTSAAGSMSGADKTKLDGIASGATANSSDATLLARANHTGTQAASTITGLGGAATLNVGTTTGTVAAGDDSRITGALSTATAATTYQPLTANLTALGANDDAYYLGRGNHTGTQAFSTVSMATARILGRTTAGSGATEEITIGTGLSLSAGTLTATGGGGGSGTKTLERFTPRDNQPPAVNFATLNTRNSVAVLEFDAATQESSTFVGVIPEGANLASGLLVRIWWMGATATTGNVRWGASFEATGTDLDTDSFDTVTQVTSAASGTSGVETVAEITCTAIDSLAAGNRFRLRVDRIAADAGNDTMTGDAQMVAAEVRGVA